ncbi:MAG: hypothetical protein MI974_27965 [Chitinophagales bacterium]|nr:hypothetical protein [Chitinophagales bacterium]
MDKLIKLGMLFSLIAVLFAACEKDELDIDALTDFPPGIYSVSPADNGKITIGNFDVRVDFVDGQASPLSSATVIISDEFGNELGSATKALSGTRDSLIIPGSDFNAELLGAGNYTLDISVTDSKGQTAERTTVFEISLLAFAANNNEMYLAGGFNGWGADAFELVGDYTWELRDVDLLGDEWKIKNTPDWTDQDWGDSDCDGIMENTTGGGPNTACGYSGLSIVTFNDQTLEYSVRPAVEFATNLSGLYLMGDFNDFEGGEFGFSLVDDNTWTIAEVPMEPGHKFRFAEMPNFMGKNFSDTDGDGVAEEFGETNIVFPENAEPGYYSFTFNDATLEYSYEFVSGFSMIESIGIIGSATQGGWDSDTDMIDNGDGTYSVFIGLLDGEIKFRANDDWIDDWGDDDADGVAEYKGANIAVSFGVYRITFDLNTLNYTLEPMNIGIIGSATPGGWDSDTDMTPDAMNPNILTVNIDLIDGEVKFRANDDWIDDWGDDDADGVAEYKGANIAVSTGTYDVSFNINTLEYTIN